MNQKRPELIKMVKKIATKQLTSKQIGDLLEQAYKRWMHLLTVGGSDPAWEDGCNMNLVRNHIIYYRKLVEENLQPEDYPEAYGLELPPYVHPKYMADANGIRERASSTLETITQSADYGYLLSYSENHQVDKEKQKLLFPVRTVGYIRAAIESDNLVQMRRYSEPERILQEMAEARENLERKELVPKELPLGQLSIFDLIK